MAPVIDLLLRWSLNLPIGEIATVTGVCLSLALAVYIGNLKFGDLKSIVVKMKPWNFGLIIFWDLLQVGYRCTHQ